MTTPTIYRLYAPGDLRREPFDLSPLGPHDVHLRSRLGAISSGTESAWYFGTDPQLHPNYRPIRFPHPTFPRVLGYEKVAEVVALGSEVTGLHIGQRVIANYGHATEYVWPASQVAPIPDGVSDDEAVFATLMNVASHGVRRSGLRLGDSVMITGQGIVGIATLIAARLAGAGHIIVTDWHDHRLALAQKFGADVALNSADGNVAQQIIDRFGLGSIDVGFECSSNYDALIDLAAVTRRNGRVVVMAQLKGRYPQHPVFGVEFHLGEIDIIASDGGWNVQRFARWYFGAIQRGAVQHMADLITHRVTFDNLESGFALLQQQPQHVVKVIVAYPH